VREMYLIRHITASRVLTIKSDTRSAAKSSYVHNRLPPGYRACAPSPTPGLTSSSLKSPSALTSFRTRLPSLNAMLQSLHPPSLFPPTTTCLHIQC